LLGDVGVSKELLGLGVVLEGISRAGIERSLASLGRSEDNLVTGLGDLVVRMSSLRE